MRYMVSQLACERCVKSVAVAVAVAFAVAVAVAVAFKIKRWTTPSRGDHPCWRLAVSLYINSVLHILPPIFDDMTAIFTLCHYGGGCLVSNLVT